MSVFKISNDKHYGVVVKMVDGFKMKKLLAKTEASLLKNMEEMIVEYDERMKLVNFVNGQSVNGEN
jgi:hypothetical protein